jgi:hypothetical protein
VVRYLKRAILAVVLTAVAVYIADALWFRYRLASSRNPFGTVHIERYYAVRMKNGKTEFMFDKPGDEPCSNSLFPHANRTPCWYLARNPRVRVDM